VANAASVRAGALIVLLTVLSIVVLHEAEALCVPVLLSVLLAYALEPIVKTVMRARVPRAAAALLVYSALLYGAAIAAHIVRAKARSFLDDLPATIAEMNAAIAPSKKTAGPLDRLQSAANDLQKTLEDTAQPSAISKVVPVRRFDARDYLLPAGVTATAVGFRVGVIGALTLLLLITGDLYKRKVIDIAGPRRADRQRTIDVINTIDRQIERFLLVRIVISVIVGAATGIGVAYVGLEHAFVWGVVAGVLNVLPFIGPAVAVALITLAAFLQFGTLERTAMAGGAALAVAALEGNLITPWLTGRAGELNTVAVFVSVLFWGWIWNMWGLLLAVPIMVAIKAAADHIEPLQPLGELLGR